MPEPLKETLARVVEDFKKLTPEEMQTKLEKARNSDWGRLLQGLHEFELFLEEQDDPAASNTTQEPT